MAGSSNFSELLQSPQDRQFAGLLNDLLDRLDTRFSDLDKDLQARFKAAADEIGRMKRQHEHSESGWRQRFNAIAADHHGGDYRGPFACREDGAALAELQTAGITPGSGPEGGYLLREEILEGILRDVEEAGIFLRNCPALPVTTLKGGSTKRTSGLTVYHPDFGVAGTVSTPGFGKNNWDLKRFVVATEVDNWMLASDLHAVLGDFVASEIAYALALASDTYWFMGDGTGGNCGYTGLFKRSDLLRVVGDSGDDTFAEMIAKSTHYLGKVLGTLPLWAHRSEPKWYMHLLTLFAYLGVRDTTGQPIANIIAQPTAPGFYLMGYPVEPVQIAPSATAVSTTFALFGSLVRACRTYRHKNAVELKMTDQLKWLEAETTFAADVPQDMIVRNGNGVVQLTTAGS